MEISESLKKTISDDVQAGISRFEHQRELVFPACTPGFAGNATSRYALGWPYSGLHNR
ncbi:MAG: hypothetical protein Q7U66_11715 [Methylobacter sp.]|nr:hypothetical protein [Methylobacter sp.]